MKKTPSLFKRDYEGDRNVYDEVVEGSEWVFRGEGTPTVKWDGTCCLIRLGELYRRHDRKRQKESGRFRKAPDGWEPCEERPDKNTGHWPGWLPVHESDPTVKWHLKAWGEVDYRIYDGTYELIGPKVQGNPYKIERQVFVKHGAHIIDADLRSYDEVYEYLKYAEIEGIVWHHDDGRLVKIKRRDFGLKWPSDNPMIPV